MDDQIPENSGKVGWNLINPRSNPQGNLSDGVVPVPFFVMCLDKIDRYIVSFNIAQYSMWIFLNA